LEFVLDSKTIESDESGRYEEVVVDYFKLINFRSRNPAQGTAVRHLLWGWGGTKCWSECRRL